MNIRREELPNLSNLAQQIAPALVDAGQALIAQMHLRVQRGIGLDDAEMPKYAASTAAAKRRRGRDATVRNLTQSGSMLRSMHLESVAVEGSSVSIAIGFSNADDALKAQYNQQRAPWFGASPKDREVIGKVLASRIAKIVEDVR